MSNALASLPPPSSSCLRLRVAAESATFSLKSLTRNGVRRQAARQVRADGYQFPSPSSTVPASCRSCSRRYAARTRRKRPPTRPGPLFRSARTRPSSQDHAAGQPSRHPQPPRVVAVGGGVKIERRLDHRRHRRLGRARRRRRRRLRARGIKRSPIPSNSDPLQGAHGPPRIPERTRHRRRGGLPISSARRSPPARARLYDVPRFAT